MSHVDEGVLHAYLDGALDEYPADEAREIRDHLEACDACAARLEEARALRAAAAAILAQADPGPMEFPSLEELRREASAGGSAGGRLSRLHRLAWAASVVVALGAGWMARARLPTEPALRAPARTEAAGEAVPSTSEEARPPAEPASAEPPPAEPAFAGPDPSADEAAPEADLSEVVRQTPAETAAPEGLLDVRAERELPTAPAGARAAAADAPEPVVELRRRVEPGAGRAVQASAFEAAATGAARSDLAVRDADAEVAAEPPLTVPGLRVLTVTSLTLPDGPGVRVLQRTEEGDTIELLHLPAGADPLAVDPVVGTSELVAARGRGWVVLRGRVSVERLRELLRLLEGAG